MNHLLVDPCPSEPFHELQLLVIIFDFGFVFLRGEVSDKDVLAS